MSSIGNETRRGLRDLERATGNETVTTNARSLTFICVANVAESSKIFGVGGFGLEADLSVYIRTELLPADHETNGPKEKQQWTYSGNGRMYRIDHKSRLPGGEVYKFTCNDPSKGVNG
jgi:hypothetical protein